MKTVLVVDDDPAVRAFISSLLKASKYNAIEAEDGLDALKVLENASPVDMVVSDIRMPGLSGYELAKMVRQMQPKMPILLVSGFGEVQNEIPLGFFETLGIEFLAKPFSLQTFIEKINSILDPTNSGVSRNNTRLYR